MSTPAYLVKRNLDGSYVGVHLNHDGYPSRMGPTLKQHFNAEEKVDELIALGSLCSMSRDGEVIAYQRDRGETSRLNKPIFSSLLDTFLTTNVYVWLCDEARWSMHEI